MANLIRVKQIEKVTQQASTLTLSSTSITIYGSSKTGTFTYNYNGDGAINVASSDTSVATCSVNTSTSTVTVTYIKAGSCKITISASETPNYSRVEASIAVACARSTPTLTLSTSSLTVAGGTGSNSFTYTYNGGGSVTVKSSNTSVATVSVSGTKVTVAYVAAGSATITVSAAQTEYYSAISKACNITCSRTSVTIPSLSSTSVAWIGSSVSPGVNNLNTNLVNQTGTTSANSAGTWTVYWNLKNTSAYCWSDGSTTQKSQTWSTYGGTIYIYIRVTYSGSSRYATIPVSYSSNLTLNGLVGKSSNMLTTDTWNSGNTFRNFYYTSFAYTGGNYPFTLVRTDGSTNYKLYVKARLVTVSGSSTSYGSYLTSLNDSINGATSSSKYVQFFSSNGY